jgi:hypothetical protein
MCAASVVSISAWTNAIIITATSTAEYAEAYKWRPANISRQK